MDHSYGWKVDYAHLTSSFFGALETVPRVGKKENLVTRNELCVTICPLFNGSFAHVVLLHGHRNPSIRGGVQLIQEEVVRLKDNELESLAPEYNSDGSLKEFKSPVIDDFSLEDKVATPKTAEILAPVDVEAEKGAAHWIRSVKSGSERSVGMEMTSDSDKASDKIRGDTAASGGATNALGGGSEEVGANFGVKKDSLDDEHSGGGSVGVGSADNSSTGGGTKPTAGRVTRSLSLRNKILEPQAVLHLALVELCWDSDERMLKAANMSEDDAWPDASKSKQLSLLYAAYGKNAISGFLPDDVVKVFFTARKKKPKYPRVHYDEEFADKCRPPVREEVDGLKDGKILYPITEEQRITES